MTIGLIERMRTHWREIKEERWSERVTKSETKYMREGDRDKERQRARKRGTEGEREIETWTKREIDRESEMETKERKRKNPQDTAGYRCVGVF